jgi:hypothetical protein
VVPLLLLLLLLLLVLVLVVVVVVVEREGEGVAAGGVAGGRGASGFGARGGLCGGRGHMGISMHHGALAHAHAYVVRHARMRAYVRTHAPTPLAGTRLAPSAPSLSPSALPPCRHTHACITWYKP